MVEIQKEMNMNSIKGFESQAYRKQLSVDVLIVGAGMAGLTTSIYLARAGRSVMIVEQSSTIGGRARTTDLNGYQFNQGPHALYLLGSAARILGELGITYRGGSPAGYIAIKKGKMFPLPTTLRSMLSSKLLKISSKIEALRFLSTLNKIQTAQVDSVSVDDWIRENTHHQDFADLLRTYFRVSSYTNEPMLTSAGSILAQFQMATLGGVLYIDEGWQALVDQLRDAALEANVKIISGKKAVAVEQSRNNSVWMVDLSDGSQITASSLVIAAGPLDTYKLFRNKNVPASISRFAKEAIPVKVATLDVALSSLPRPDRLVALGIDKPLYLSVHSAFAKLAPLHTEGAVIHVIKYLGSSLTASEESHPNNTEFELEDLIDLVQPGWRNVVVKKRFLPNMIVSNALVTASQGGIRGRPAVKVRDAEDLYIVGDWTGHEGLLLDASLSSAKHVAEWIRMEKQEADFKTMTAI